MTGNIVVWARDLISLYFSGLMGSDRIAIPGDKGSCIREYGFISSQARLLRLAALQVRYETLFQNIPWLNWFSYFIPSQITSFGTLISRSKVPGPNETVSPNIVTVSPGEMTAMRVSGPAQLAWVRHPTQGDSLDDVLQIYSRRLKHKAPLRLRPQGTQVIVCSGDQFSYTKMVTCFSLCVI